MAGDWFPLQYWRSRCPEVVRAASATGRTRHEILGYVCDFWSWVSTESADGHVPGVHVCDLPEILGGDAALWAALRAVGWVDEDAGGIIVPGWHNWLCESAKKRAKDAKRKRGARAEGDEKPVRKTSKKRPRNVRDASTKSPPTGQDITEENKEEKTPLPPAEPGGGTVEPPTPDITTESEPSTEAEPVPAFAELVGEWVAAKLPGHDSPAGIQRTSNRVGHWQARLRDPTWAARWREAVRRAGRSARCRGEDPKWPQGLRLDTFVSNPDLLVRLLEGEFDAAPAVETRGGKQTIDDVINDAFRNRNSGGTS